MNRSISKPYYKKIFESDGLLVIQRDLDFQIMRKGIWIARISLPQPTNTPVDFDQALNQARMKVRKLAEHMLVIGY